ncbi:MarR family transcriptional regulator [Streptococcus suis]|nr:MarR family transcriptional regulator [Streptococcus suis]
MTAMNDLLYQVKLADESITRLFEKQLGISLTRYQLLTSLLDQAPCSQQDLQESLQIDRAAITRHLKILEETGYISRRQNPDSKREMVVEPTAKAVEDLVTAPPSQHLQVKQAMDAILTDEEATQLTQLLSKLVTGLEALPFDTINN